MKKIDFERAAMLMDVQQKVANVGVMMASIGGEAGEELKAINADCLENARERAEKIRQEEQVAEQQRLRAAEESAAENDKPRGPIQPAEGQPLAPGLPTPDHGVAEPIERRL